MCGIVAYTGSENASGILLGGLGRLEYRGYDSAGVAIQNGKGIVTRKKAGRLVGLTRTLEADPITGGSGIAHTRWATHGAPNERNAHPHLDSTGEIAVCHNGIIENADTLRMELERRGHVFVSDTDSEVLAHLINEHWVPPLQLAVSRALSMVEGTYGIAVISSREPGRVVCARKGSPLLIGVGEDGMYAASDAAALLRHTRKVIYLEDGEMAVLDEAGCDIVRLDMARVDKRVEEIEWNLEEAERGGNPHFMLKEILEQPETLSRTMSGRITRDASDVRLGGLRDVGQRLAEAKRIVITACGTSWHAGMIGKFMIEQYARVQTDVEYASEWRYRDPVLDPDTVVIGVSQSGETADTLAAIELATERGCLTLGVVNVVGSSLARRTEAGVYLHAGPEIGVASTKAFTSQVVTLSLIAIYLGRLKGMAPDEVQPLLAELETIPDKVREVLRGADEIEKIAGRLADYPNFLYLGRGYSFPVALEGALKLKEISYLHAEGFSAAEMKHGPIALIDEDMPVVVVAPRDGAYAKVLSNMQEVKARGGHLVAITTEPNGLAELADECIIVPPTIDALLPVITTIPLQLLAYHIGVKRGCDVDKPRNLAKSVTVE